MITQSDINSVLGQALSNLGHPVCNAALWRYTVSPDVTDEAVKAECDRIRASLIPVAANPIALAEAHIGRFFSDLILLDGFKRIVSATASGSLAAIPKTIATATWVETVKQIAIAGSTTFPDAPFTVQEVLSE